MKTLEHWIRIAKDDCGFDEAGNLNLSAVTFMPEVRDMCRADRCNRYNKSWSCPPACGSLTKIQKDISAFHNGFLVQSIGQLEDEFDVETMMETEQLHKESFSQLVHQLAESNTHFYAMSAGSCTICKECTYPDSPCRFPKEMFPSMEACGIMVSDVCRDSGMQYNHGKNTICYTSCILITF
ncbi:MAG: DUF2284 domain-containing protein [Hespellia sp.]|nr:DUF2284 domain-containing protein [Hespellia sp.]